MLMRHVSKLIAALLMLAVSSASMSGQDSIARVRLVSVTDEVSARSVKPAPSAQCLSVKQGIELVRSSSGDGEAPSVKLSAGHGDVEVRMASLSDDPEKQVQVQYQLVRGSETVFSITTVDDTLTLPEMKSGTYTLHARVLGSGAKAEDKVILTINVSSPALVCALAGLLFALLLSALALLYLRRPQPVIREVAPQPQTQSDADVLKQLSIPVPRYNDIEMETTNLTLLVVDDDPALCTVIKEKFSSKFKYVCFASNGRSGYDLALDRKPDVVLTEVVLPHMNGFELCRAIKGEQSLSSTIVIFLTSHSSTESQTLAFRMGGDATVPKPFQPEAVYGIIKSVLKNHNDIKIHYSSSSLLTGSLSEMKTYTSSDEQFVIKLNDFIKENISNPDLNVDMIVDHMCVSRTTLFNKMNSLLGTSAVKYIRRMRIEVAKELLSSTGKSVGEVALETGFTESQYFSTVFKQETGVPPSAFRK